MSLKLLARKLRTELAKRQAQAQAHKPGFIVLYAGEQAPEGTPDTAFIVHTTTHKAESYPRLG